MSGRQGTREFLVRNGLLVVGLTFITFGVYAWVRNAYVVALLLWMAGWVLAGTALASRWVGIVPPPLEDLPEDERWTAVQSFQGLQAAANVARWKRVFVIGGLLFLCFGWKVASDAAQRCDSRIVANGNIRSAIGVAVDEVADYAGLDSGGRQDVRDRVDGRVVEQYPPPDC